MSYLHLILKRKNSKIWEHHITKESTGRLSAAGDRHVSQTECGNID
jgi:hypothetical protein